MKRIFTSILLGVFCVAICGHAVYAQGLLPAFMTAAERNIMGGYLHNVSPAAYSITTPPAGHVRTMAEWEEIDGIMITWTSYPGILAQIVQAAQTETRVYIVCSDSNSVKNYLTNAAIPLANITYVIAPYNSVWARDYGQWNAYTNDVDSLLLVDWIYNRPRPKDDTVPSAIAQVVNLPLYSTTQAPNDLVHTGGNFMVDGFGTGFSSKLIELENSSKSEAQIDTIMSRFMGISRYILMDTLPYDGIHHIDMHIKLLDEETLLVGQFPANTSDGPQLEANLLYVLSNFNSVYGTPYKIYRVPMPSGANNTYPPAASYRTYTNSVFINKSILVPTYYEQYDTTALRVYREALPGYTIVPINVESMISASGALHCITKEIGSSDPLLISHQALHDTSFTGPYEVKAYMKHRSGIASAKLYYRTDTTQPYSMVSMSQTAQPDYWSGNIPAQTAGTRVYYYVSVTSVSGKSQLRPMPAPAAYWSFLVTGTACVPNISTVKAEDVFPNPSNGITCIPLKSSAGCTVEIDVTDVLGRPVQHVHSGKIQAGESFYFFNSKDWAAGIYYVTVRSTGDVMTQRVVVQH